VARDYLAEYFTDESTLRGLLGYGATYPTSPDLVRGANAAISWFERRTKQTHVALVQSRRYSGDGSYVLKLDRALIEATAITIDGEAISLTGILDGDELGPGIEAPEWHRDPRLIIDDDSEITAWTRPSRRRIPNIVITGRWGACDGDKTSPVVPADVEQALLALIADTVSNPSDLDLRLAKRAPGLKTMSVGGRTHQTAVHGFGKFIADPMVAAVILEHRAPDRLIRTL
jgi:hypothetical protein